jgi:hypothetical protein
MRRMSGEREKEGAGCAHTWVRRGPRAGRACLGCGHPVAPPGSSLAPIFLIFKIKIFHRFSGIFQETLFLTKSRNSNKSFSTGKFLNTMKSQLNKNFRNF